MTRAAAEDCLDPIQAWQSELRIVSAPAMSSRSPRSGPYFLVHRHIDDTGRAPGLLAGSPAVPDRVAAVTGPGVRCAAAPERATAVPAWRMPRASPGLTMRSGWSCRARHVDQPGGEGP